MSTTVPMPEVTRLSTAAEDAAIRSQDTKTREDFDLADAEEEEFEELWAADRGNQGA